MNLTGDMEEIRRTSDILHRNWKNIASFLWSACRTITFPTGRNLRHP